MGVCVRVLTGNKRMILKYNVFNRIVNVAILVLPVG
jgi:hypothetical protein